MNRPIGGFFNGGGSIPIGGMVEFPDSLPIQIVDSGMTWLRSQYLETNPANFNATYWDHTRGMLWAKRLEYSNRAITGASANGDTVIVSVSSDGTSQGGLNVSTDGGATWSGMFILPNAGLGTTGVNAIRWVQQLAMWIAVGGEGQVWTSATGINGSWTFRSSGTTNQLRAIEYANNVVVIVGDSGTIITSLNGTSYQVRTSNVTSGLLSVAFHNNVWLAVGVQTASQSARSTDNGATWTAVTVAGGSTNAARVFTGNNLFVLCATGGFGGVFTSTTGATGSWTLVSGTQALSPMGGSYNGEFYIFNELNTTLYKTFDLTNFRRISHGVGGNSLKM